MGNHINEKEKNYDDIINLPHHVSRKRPQMPLADRAAQFSPFAAVVGHEASVTEAARLTDEKRELDEAQKTIINEQLNKIQAQIQDQIQVGGQSETGVEVEIEHFQADTLKTGGQYIVRKGMVQKIDVYTRSVHMAGGTEIAIDNVFRVVIL